MSDQPEERKGLSMMCLACRGSGSLVREVAAMVHGENRLGSSVMQETCADCGGSGFLEGFTPPV